MSFTKMVFVKDGEVAEVLREKLKARYTGDLFSGNSPLNWRFVVRSCRNVAQINPQDTREVCEILTEILLKPDSGFKFWIEDNPKDDSIFFVTHR
ncbi:MAG: hypothetical protein PHT40_02900 [Patescibacteria group bacterium]|nr:hypothetical protein [Patescibacteria group bacterium]